MKVQFICLANSRRESGRCIAGIRKDEGGWFRPISKSTGGPLMHKDYLLEDGNIPELLDTIEVEVAESKPEVYQPENWTLESTTWKLINKVNPTKAFQLLESFILSESDLFGTKNDRVALSFLKANPIPASLALIEPDDVSWFITTSIRGKRQTRAIFKFYDTNYTLGITDVEWERRLSDLSLGIHPKEASGFGESDTLLFTLSLGGPLNGECFKLVAGVVVLPPRI